MFVSTPLSVGNFPRELGSQCIVRRGSCRGCLDTRRRYHFDHPARDSWSPSCYVGKATIQNDQNIKGLRLRYNVCLFEIVKQTVICIKCFLRFRSLREGKVAVLCHPMTRIMQDHKILLGFRLCFKTYNEVNESIL